MLVSNVTINTYSKIGYLWNAFKNQILQPKADQWNWSATLHTSSYNNKLGLNFLGALPPKNLAFHINAKTWFWEGASFEAIISAVVLCPEYNM